MVLFKLLFLATGGFLKFNMFFFVCFIFLWSSADRLSKEVLIKKHLRDIMTCHADLGNLTSRMVRRGGVEASGFCGRVWLASALPLQVLDKLTSRVNFELKPYKKYIDNEILVTLAQMDRPSKIFDYLYLVGDSLTSCLSVNTRITVKNFPSLCLTNCQKSNFTRKSSWDLNFLFEGSVEGDSMRLFLFFPPSLSPELDLYVISGLWMERCQFWRTAEKQVSVVTCTLWGFVAKVCKLSCLLNTQFCHRWVIPQLLVSYPFACQCGLHPECDEGDRQLLPRVLHLHEHQSLRCGSFRPAPSLDRHLRLHRSRKVVFVWLFLKLHEVNVDFFPI